MAANNKFNWITVINDSVKVANFEDIKNDLINEYAYLHELVDDNNQIVPLAKNSADYIFLSNVALGIWNMANLIYETNISHRIDIAQGNYLDKIMGYYNFVRLPKETYFIKVRVHGNNMLELGQNDFLFAENNSLYEFEFYAKLENNSEEFQDYLLVAKDYYQGLYPTELKDLNLIHATLDIYTKTNETQNKVLGLQRLPEIDDAFKNRLINSYNQKDKYLILNNIEHLNIVDDIHILQPKDTVGAFINAEFVKKGQICVFIKFKDSYYELSKEDKQIKVNDIELEFLEYLPLGTEMIKAPNNILINYLENQSPINDFIVSKTVLNEILPWYMGVAIRVIANGDEIENLAYDTLNTYLKKIPLNYTFNKSTVLADMKRYWNMFNDDVYFVLADEIKKPLEFKEWNTKQENNKNIHTLDSLVLNNGTKDIVAKPLANITNYYFANQFTKYLYKQNEDGTYSVVFY